MKKSLEKNNEEQRIEVKDLPSLLPNYRETNLSKDVIIANWLKNWLKEREDNGKVLLPKKELLARYLKVSVGTIQNAIRLVEDEGYLQSKQRLGTFITSPLMKKSPFKKLTSKRESAIELIKKYIASRYKKDDKIPSVRQISKEFSISINTTRLAIEHLCSSNILRTETNNNMTSRFVENVPVNLAKESLANETLVEKIGKDIEEYIAENYKVGDKLNSHEELANIFGVSIKTIHDSLRELSNKGIINSRRGRYGTIVVRNPKEDGIVEAKEHTIFAPAEAVQAYRYERIEKALVYFIQENYTVGDKLPSLEQLSEEFEVSTSTIRKSLSKLEKEGFIEFSRGRYGGTFVTEIPFSKGRSSFEWIAVNPSYREYCN